MITRRLRLLALLLAAVSLVAASCGGDDDTTETTDDAGAPSDGGNGGGGAVHDFVPLDTGGPLTKAALEAGDIDVALLFSSDGAIAANGWVLLEDDQDLQPV